MYALAKIDAVLGYTILKPLGYIYIGAVTINALVSYND